MNKEIILYVLRDYKRLLNPDCFEEYEDFEKMKEMADEAIEELSKSEKFSYQDEVIKGFDGFIGRYAKYNPKKSDISKVLPELVKASFRVPPFA